MKPSRANALTAAGLLALLAVVLLTAPRWTRLLSRPVPGEEASAGEPKATPPPEEPEKVVERQINVKLFFQATDRPGLVMEERAVTFSSDLGQQLQNVVEELIRGPKGGLGPTMAAETKVRQVFVGASGVAYVSLSHEVTQGHLGGSAAELITVYSLVNSLAANFPAVKRVQVLIDDRPAATLAGHVDLMRPLPPDMTLLAAASLRPASPVVSELAK